MASIHYMRSSVYGLTLPVAITPTRLSHEEEDPSLHILAADRNDQHQQRFRQLRHERPISSASSRGSTASKGITSRSLGILERKARQLLAQFSHGSTSRAIPTQSTHEDKRMSRTLNYIRHGNQIPEYIPIDVPEPVVPRRDRRSEARTSVYSSHCLVSGNATRRSSRYFQI